MPLKALVIERDGKLARFLVRLLSEQGFAADAASSGPQGFAQASIGIYDLAIVDVDLVGTCAESALRTLRDGGGTMPILAIGSQAPARTAAVMLRAGADDYLAKPFDVDELVVRIHAVVRRAAGSARVRIGELEIDRIGGVARHRGVELKLSSREYALLCYLATRTTAVSKRELLARVWADCDREPSSNILEVTISRLRDRLGDAQGMVETVRGIGYRFTERPTESLAATPSVSTSRFASLDASP